MTRDLFALVFEELSSFSAGEYQTCLVEQLPALMLRVALEACPALASLRGFADVERSLSESNAHWKNPELYPHLTTLQGTDLSASQAHLDALRVHLNLLTPNVELDRAYRFVRLREPQPKVLENSGSTMREIHDAVCSAQGDSGPLVYRPYPSLFNDVAHGLDRKSVV